MKTLIVGDTTDYLYDYAKSIDSSTSLISEFSVLQDGTYHLSLGDITDLSTFVKILEQADKLIYCPPDIWSDDTKGHSYMKQWTEFYLRFFKSSKTVIGLKDSVLLQLSDVRKSESPQIWNTGCSITVGVGVQKRYGQIIADELDMPISFIACPGSSLDWAADQILRSDIRKDDIVLWGMTSHNRLPYYEGKLNHILASNCEVFPDTIPMLDNEDRIFQSVSKIFQVVNFCDKVGAKLVMLGLMLNYKILEYVSDIPSLIQMYGYSGLSVEDMFPDFGSDGIHPGELTHQWYADTALRKIRE